ncbi:PhzF family phenazine biosynthesis protein [Pseudomonas sp. GD03842]|uniref:PhzF family phenazine biosynthesis protein n=1 Tax=Pseudomonas sp. GD03842 TaxID=2975385 RepID=UPI002449318C|nr:PhzF family phenazine biosynthesis protein [Pseudomonas sp. GD03842]MDH0745426.1 PhzF family phenazine biosynthesis protein [Pseudomonas sp. GD03842]
MPQTLKFQQVDVFSSTPTEGNPLAVVGAADDMTDAQMAAFARWTNLSETTFLMRPTHPDADYRVRIFTTTRELPFAGHPTLGSCFVWLDNGGVPKGEEIVQECGAGLVRIRRDGSRLAFSAPPLLRSGPVETETLQTIAAGLRIPVEQIVASQWADNGPGWVAVMLADRDALLAIRPDYTAFKGLNVGVVAPWTGADKEADFEVRAFTGDLGAEDPVTGSLNASLAQWLIPAGLAPSIYTARQGTAMGHRGRINIKQVGEQIWIGGDVQQCIEGKLMI